MKIMFGLGLDQLRRDQLNRNSDRVSCCGRGPGARE